MMRHQANSTRHFYQAGKLSAIMVGGVGQRIFRSHTLPLAHLVQFTPPALLATEKNGSILYVISASEKQENTHSYSPYGYDPLVLKKHRPIAFNGEPLDLITEKYFLGGGYRFFSPLLMRFQSPDNISPFGKGKINSYAYCSNDPINWQDPSGHAPVKDTANRLIRWAKNTFGTRARQHYTVTGLNDNTPLLTHAAQERVDRYNTANTLANSDDRRGAAPTLDELRLSINDPPNYFRAIELLDAPLAGAIDNRTTVPASPRQSIQSIQISQTDIRRPSETPNPYLTSPNVSNFESVRLEDYGFSSIEIRNRLAIKNGQSSQ